MIPSQVDVDRWSAIVTEAYAAVCKPTLSQTDGRDLYAALDGPLARCLMLAISPASWGTDFVNPTLGSWEAKVGRPRGPRLVAVDYGNGHVTMR